MREETLSSERSEYLAFPITGTDICMYLCVVCIQLGDWIIGSVFNEKIRNKQTSR